MKKMMAVTTIVLSACGTVASTPPPTAATPKQSVAQTESATPERSAMPPRQEASPGPALARPSDGLSELEAMMFGCPKAGLNAAAREAAKAPAQGRYQFTYFRVVSDSHHSLYEVHFTSNDHEDPELKYCVSVYCQQGWDPTTTKASVSLMNEPMPGKATAAAAHGAHCGSHAPPVKPRSKR